MVSDLTDFFFFKRMTFLYITLTLKVEIWTGWGRFLNSLSTMGVNKEVSLQPSAGFHNNKGTMPFESHS